MRSIPLRAWMLVILSALLQFLSFPISGPISFSRAGLCWISLVPLLLALLGVDEAGMPLTSKQAGMLGYGCGALWYVCNCSWIFQTMYLYGGMEKPVAFLILVLFALYLGLYHVLFALLVQWTRKAGYGTVGTLLLVPFLWVGVELARARVTGFPWDLLGNALVDHGWLTRIAPLGGVMAISFVVAAVNAGIAFAVLRVKRTSVMVWGGVVVLVAMLHFSGMDHFVRSSGGAAGKHVAVLMQENLAVGATAKGERPLTRGEELQQFSALSLRPDVPAGAGVMPAGGVQSPTLIIWPEAPAHLQTNDPNFVAAMSELARKANAAVIAGSLGVDFDKKAARGYYLYDSAALFDRGGSYAGRYDKIHLVPWGEYVPYKEFFSFAQKLTEGSGDVDPGHERSVFLKDGHVYGVFVCYESIFGDEVRQFVKSGAQVLVNISDDGWYGDTGAPWQHLNMARMRAIENHRWVLRSTNTGETTAIDPYGRYTETRRHVRVAYALPFDFEDGLTLYTRYGDWFASMCAVVSLMVVGFGVMRGRTAVAG